MSEKEMEERAGDWVGKGPVERFCVVREGYRKVLSEFYEQLVSERAEKLKTGDHSYTEFEALMPLLIKFLLPEEKQKCRIVLEYDPAKRNVECYHLNGEELQAVNWTTVRN